MDDSPRPAHWALRARTPPGGGCARTCVCARVCVCVCVYDREVWRVRGCFPTGDHSLSDFPGAWPSRGRKASSSPCSSGPAAVLCERALLFSLSGSRDIQLTEAPYGELGDGSGRGDRRRQRGHAGQSWPAVKQATSLGFSTRCILALSTQQRVATRKGNGKQNLDPTIKHWLFRCEAMGIVLGSPDSASARLLLSLCSHECDIQTTRCR